MDSFMKFCEVCSVVGVHTVHEAIFKGGITVNVWWCDV